MGGELEKRTKEDLIVSTLGDWASRKATLSVVSGWGSMRSPGASGKYREDSRLLHSLPYFLSLDHTKHKYLLSK